MILKYIHILLSMVIRYLRAAARLGAGIVKGYKGAQSFAKKFVKRRGATGGTYRRGAAVRQQESHAVNPVCSNARKPARRLRGRALMRVKRNIKWKRKVVRTVNEDMQPALGYLVDDHYRNTTTSNTTGFSICETWPQPAHLATLYTAYSITTGMSMFLKYVNWECTIKNQNNGNVNLRLYFCKARKHIPSKSNAGTAISPSALMTTGFTLSSSGNDPRSSLYQNPYFLQYFKIVKDCRVFLAPGQSHCINKTQKVMKYREFDRDTSNSYCCFGGSNTLVIQQTGDATDDAATKTNIGYDQSAIIVLNNLRYHFNKVLSAAAPNSTYATTTRGTITNASFYNPESGLLVTPSVPA